MNSIHRQSLPVARKAQPVSLILSVTILSAQFAWGQIEARVTEAPLAPERSRKGHAQIPPSVERYHSLNDEAHKHILAGETKLAYRLLNQAIALHPERALAYVNFGFSHSQLGEINSAIMALDKALELDPYEVRAWHVYSLLYTRLGRSDEAIDMAKACIEHDLNGRWEYRNWLGELLYRSNDYATALEQYKLGTEIIENKLQLARVKAMQEKNQINVYDVRQEVDKQTRVVFTDQGISSETVDVDMTVYETDTGYVSPELNNQIRLLEENLGNSLFRTAICLIKTGHSEIGSQMLGKGFRESESKSNQGLYWFATGRYEEALQPLKAASRGSGSSLSVLVSLLTTQIAISDNKGAKATLNSLNRRMKKRNANWPKDVLSYFSEYAIHLYRKGLGPPPRLDSSGKAKASFYKGQLHMAQDRADLAKEFLTTAASLGQTWSFESKAAVAQLALMEAN